MKSKFYAVIQIYYKAGYRFYKNEQGVYAAMTALLGFLLLGLVAFAVDGSGILLDKARLEQGMEQAALAVVAENNEFRDESTRNHAGVKSQILTSEENSKLSDSQKFRTKQRKRDQEIAKGFVQLYLPDANIKDDFDISCERLKDNDGKILKTVTCDVAGNIYRPSWLYLKDNLKNKNGKATFDPEVKIETGVVSVQKNLDDVIPVDLMMVTDLTGSMEQDPRGRRAAKGNRKIDILRDVVASLAEELLKEDSTGKKVISPHNRIGFTSFAFGAQQQNNINRCYLPYIFTNKNDGKLIANIIDNINTTMANRGNINNLGSSIREMIDFLNRNVNYEATVRSIDSFQGKDIDYPAFNSKGALCLRKHSQPHTVGTTRFWYKANEHNMLVTHFKLVEPAGSTLSSTGLLIGANVLMNSNTDPRSKPDVLQSNTQRYLIVLSDGQDEFNSAYPALNVTPKLIDHNMCNKIRDRIDTLQDKNYVTHHTKIAFVAFGYPEPQNQAQENAQRVQKAAWKKCVHEENYYEAKNKAELLKTFRQILGLEEEVGHIINK